MISKLLVEERPTHAHGDAPQEVHQLSVATCQPAVGRESIFGDVMAGYLDAARQKIAHQDIRLHSSERSNDAPRKWKRL